MLPILIFAPNDHYHTESAFRIRILDLVPAMVARGFDWQIRVRPKSPWGRLRLAHSAKDFHAVILHRKWLDPYEARALRKHSRRIVMDLDDATMLHETSLGKLARRRLDRRFHATTNILDTVCAGNDYLAQKFPNTPTRIIPSVVDPARYKIRTHTNSDTVRLAWVGSASTLKYLELAFPALAAAYQQSPRLTLMIICDHPPKNAPLPIEFHPWSLHCESTLLATADIGLAPTPETPWTLGKCGFKIIQYMAAGLPTIASPVGVNTTLLTGPSPDQCAGLLPQSWPEWPAAIQTLATNPTLRQTLGTTARHRIKSDLNLEKIADTWAQVLK